MPKTRTLIGLLIALLITALLCLAVWLITSTDSEAETHSQNIQILFDSNDPDAINSISISSSNNPSFTLIREGDAWQIDGRRHLPISQTAIGVLLDQVEQMTAIRSITEDCASISEYGLDKPICMITLTARSEAKRYLFGDYSEYYDGYYCMVEGAEAVYMVDKSYIEHFSLTVEDLLGSDTLPDLGSLRSVVWQTVNGSSVTALPDNEYTDLLNLISTLELDKWIDFGAEQYPVYHLDAPAVAQITLWDGAELQLALSIGESDEYIYLRVGESELIYLAKCDDPELLCKYIKGII